MKIAEKIWLGSIAARSNLVTAANTSAAFYSNAALQGWHLGFSTPMVFWSAFTRATDVDAANQETAPNVVDLLTVPVAATEAKPEPIAAPKPVAVVEIAVAAVETPAIVDAVIEPEVDQGAVETVVETVVETAVEAVVEAAANPVLLDGPRNGQADDLQQVRGIGAKLSANLNEVGIYHFDQVAGLTEVGINWLDDAIPGFKRSCARFDVVAGAATFL